MSERDETFRTLLLDMVDGIVGMPGSSLPPFHPWLPLGDWEGSVHVAEPTSSPERNGDIF